MDDFRPKTWIGKFACAFRGLWVGVRGQSSFAVHLPVAVGVLAIATWRGVTWTDWLLITLCIAVVLSAELFNTAIELLARAITSEYNPHVRDALDVASGAVFAAVIAAATVGVAVLL